MRGVFMFRRDLRLDDNTGLISALNECDEVIPIFIFNPRQVENNEYKGDHSFEFLLNSLDDLNEQLRTKGSSLYCFFGEPVDVLSSLEFDILYFNKDYTPFSITRDEVLEETFNVKSFDDILLNSPSSVLKGDGTPYTVFTPYYRRARMERVREPVRCESGKFFNGVLDVVSLDEIREKYLGSSNSELAVKGGRHEGLMLIEKLKEKIKGYGERRDFPFIDGTSLLSAHNKFGTISPRELFYSVSEESFIRQLYWRDFFTQIAYHFPYVFGESFQRKFKDVKWDYDEEKFNLWCRGETGFPIVDAGMRELNTTGYMHNRVRMIVSSFLTKDLHIDWRWGEKYFAQKLVDYDPCVNNGSWQWASSTGCDAQPYFRIFNPFRQQIRFDPECKYIKKWIPALQSVNVKEIHNWTGVSGVDYPKPMVEHSVERNETLKRFKK